MSDNRNNWDLGTGFLLVFLGAILMMFLLFTVEGIATVGDVMVVDGQYYVNVGRSVGSNVNSYGDWFEFDPDQPVTFIKVVDK